MEGEIKGEKGARQARKLVFYKRPCFETYKAIVLVLLSSLCFSICDAIIKSIRYMTASQLAIVRNLGLFSTNLPFLIMTGEPVIEKTTIPVLLARGVFGCLCLYTGYLGKKLMPLGESGVIIATTPIWVAVLARIFLKERLNFLNYISIVSCITGLLLMSKIFSISLTSSKCDMDFWYGCLASLSSALFGAITYVFLRRLNRINPCVTITYQSSVGVIGMVIVELVFREVNIPNCGLDSVLLLLLGLLNFFGHFAVTLAFRFDKAGPISVVSVCSKMAIQFFFQTFYFKEPPDVYSIISAVCISVSLALSVLSKYRQHQRLVKAEAVRCKEETLKTETSV